MTTLNPRFRSSSPAADLATGAPPAAKTPQAAPSASANLERFQELQRQRQALQERRIRYQVELEQAEREVAECQAAAQAFQVGSLDDLEALIVREQAEEVRQLDEFERQLAAEDTLLKGIQQQADAQPLP